MRFSVIIPVYNVEEFLSKCIESILPQLTKEDEVILVDDGSSDKSAIICDEFSAKYSNIVTIHKSNGGLSDARNVGIDIARGNYILLIDSDDTVSSSIIGNIVSILESNNYDIVNFGFRKVREDGKIVQSSVASFSGPIARDEAIKKVLMDDELNNFAWANAYKRELFENIRYPKGRLYEDKYTTYQLFDRAQSVYVIDKPLYNYLVRKGSICNSSSSERKIKGAIDNICGLLQQYDYAKERPSLNCEERLANRINTAVKSIVRFLYRVNDTDNLKSLSEIVKYRLNRMSFEVSLFVKCPLIYGMIMSCYKFIKR